MMMKISAIVCSALIGIVVGAFGYSEMYPQPGIEFDTPLKEIVSDTEVFWYAEINGHNLMCKNLRVDSHEKYGVLGGNSTDGVLHVNIPSLHNFPTDDILVDRCYIHRVTG